MLIIIILAAVQLCAFSPAPQQDDLYFANANSSEESYFPGDEIYISDGNNEYLEYEEHFDEVYTGDNPTAETEDKEAKYNCDGYTFSEDDEEKDTEEIYFADGHVEVVQLHSDEYIYCRNKWKRQVTVEIAGKQATFYYDGKEHEVSGYEIRSISKKNYKEEDFSFIGNAYVKTSGSRIWKMGLTPEMFINNNKDFDVEFVIVDDGYLYIIPPDAIITITGKTGSAEFDGMSHNISGYDASIQICESQTVFVDENGGYTCQNYSLLDPNTNALVYCNEYSLTSQAYVPEICYLYKPEDMQQIAEAYAERTEPGITNMGLDQYSFANTKTDFENVFFNVMDGYMEITGENPAAVNIPTETIDGNEITGEDPSENVPDGTIPNAAQTPDEGSDQIPTETQVSDGLSEQTPEGTETAEQNPEETPTAESTSEPEIEATDSETQEEATPTPEEEAQEDSENNDTPTEDETEEPPSDEQQEDLPADEESDPAAEDTQTDLNEENQTEEPAGPDSVINVVSSAGTSITEGDVVTLTASVSDSTPYIEYLYIWEELSADGTWHEVYRSSSNSYEYTAAQNTVNAARRVTVFGRQY